MTLVRVGQSTWRWVVRFSRFHTRSPTCSRLVPERDCSPVLPSDAPSENQYYCLCRVREREGGREAGDRGERGEGWGRADAFCYIVYTCRLEVPDPQDSKSHDSHMTLLYSTLTREQV